MSVLPGQAILEPFYGPISSQNIDESRDVGAVATTKEGEPYGEIKMLSLYAQLTGCPFYE